MLARLGILDPGIADALGVAGLASISASLDVLLWARSGAGRLTFE